MESILVVNIARTDEFKVLALALEKLKKRRINAFPFILKVD